MNLIVNEEQNEGFDMESSRYNSNKYLEDYSDNDDECCMPENEYFPASLKREVDLIKIRGFNINILCFL